MKRFGYTLKFFLILFLISSLGGCETEADAELTNYIQQVQQKKPLPIPPIPEVVPLQKFVYPEDEHRRSPFQPREAVKQSDEDAPNMRRAREPLEEFPLDALKFVGVLKQGPIIWALIKQPNGVITKVTTGNYMGKNFGKIVKISENSLKLEETVQVEGKWEKKITVFNLTTDK